MPGWLVLVDEGDICKKTPEKKTLNIVNLYEHFKTVDLEIFAEYQMMFIWKTERDKLENHNKNVYACILLALQNILYNAQHYLNLSLEVIIWQLLLYFAK